MLQTGLVGSALGAAIALIPSPGGWIFLAVGLAVAWRLLRVTLSPKGRRERRSHDI